MMNYSGQAIYGRKIIKGIQKQKSEYYKILYMSWAVCMLIGLIIGVLLFWGISSLFKDEPVKPIESNPTDVETKVEVEMKDEVPSYGTIDGKVFNDEISMDWGNAFELGFVPLDVPMDEEMQEFIYCLSYGYNIEFTFIMALIEHESSFKANIISKTNDYGLMQINFINHAWLKETLGVTNFLDPYQNVRSGIFILRKLFEKYEDPAKVLMAYNMGESGARRLWEQGIYETNYSSNILKQVAEYKKQISEKGEVQ